LETTSRSRMHGVCHASVGRVQVREDSLVLRNPDIVLFRIVRETQKIKEREVVYMDDIEKLKAENSDLRTKVDELNSNKYCLEGELRKATETNERLLRIVENLSKGH
jgi:predicted RNase H-like nuclease (RuvC/YqgF family)